jgi:hypothetical protein
LPSFPPSLRLKEPQTKPTSLPTERLQEISWQDFWRSHDPRALVHYLLNKTFFFVVFLKALVVTGAFWCFWLTIQNTTNRHVSNAFGLLAVFISFPLARCAPRPHPAPLVLGEGSTKKKIACGVGVGGWACLRRFGRGRIYICVRA